MREEIHGLDGFYATPTGLVAARLLRDRLRGFWPALPGQSVLGLGYASPFLRLWREEAARCVALVPPHLPRWRWPRKAPCRTAVGEEDALPFPDLSFDRVLLVHGLETAENARRVLREAWRVLKDDGRLLVAAPNRLSFWAQLERTPFGHGQPYSPGQLERLLLRQMFRVERRGAALYVPPFKTRLLLRSAEGWERLGPRVFPRFAGLTLVEAEKDMFAAIPAPATMAPAVLAPALRHRRRAAVADRVQHRFGSPGAAGRPPEEPARCRRASAIAPGAASEASACGRTRRRGPRLPLSDARC